MLTVFASVLFLVASCEAQGGEYPPYECFQMLDIDNVIVSVTVTIINNYAKEYNVV